MTDQPQRPVTDLNDYDYAVAALRETVKVNGEDFIYFAPPSAGFCSYADADEGAPSCLVGHLLHRHGVSVEDLLAEDAGRLVPLSNGNFAHGGGAFDIGPDFGIEDEDVRSLLNVAQVAQDNKIPWGKAVEDAIHDTDQRRRAFGDA